MNFSWKMDDKGVCMDEYWDEIVNECVNESGMFWWNHDNKCVNELRMF